VLCFGVLDVISGEGGMCGIYPDLFTLHTIPRWSFNVTLFVAGIFGLASGGAPSFIALASLIAMVGVGAGGLLLSFLLRKPVF